MSMKRHVCHSHFIQEYMKESTVIHVIYEKYLHILIWDTSSNFGKKIRYVYGDEQTHLGFILILAAAHTHQIEDSKHTAGWAVKKTIVLCVEVSTSIQYTYVWTYVYFVWGSPGRLSARFPRKPVVPFAIKLNKSKKILTMRSLVRDSINQHCWSKSDDPRWSSCSEQASL